MKNYIISTLVVLAVTAGTTAHSQDVVYSQPYANPGVTNPALTGMNTAIKATLQYRQQWSSVENGYTTYGFSGQYPILLNEGKEKLDLGLYAMNNKEGAFSRTGVSLSVGYNLRLSDAGHINVSLLAGYQQNAIKMDALSFDDQYILGAYSAGNATAEVISSEKTSYVDVGAGAMWYYLPEGSPVNAFIGIGAFHLNKPNDAFAGGNMRLMPRYTGQMGLKLIGKGNIDFLPNAYYLYQGGTQLFAPGIMIDYRAGETAKMGIGGWLKGRNSITLMASFTYSFFQLGYSYDIYHSQINNYITGLSVHEVSLSFRFDRTGESGRAMSPMF